MNSYMQKLIVYKSDNRKMLIAGSAVAMVAVAWFGAWLGASRARYRVTGKIDPTTGYRIEYTVSSRYHKTTDKDAMAQARRELEAWAFDPPARSANKRTIGHMIRQATIRGVSPPGTMVDTDGYVELTGIVRIGTPIFTQHLLVSECPATWCGVDLQVGPSNENKLIQRFFCLFIRPKSHPIIYGFVGMTGADITVDEVQNEMIAIRDSIRIEKVSSSAVSHSESAPTSKAQ